MQILRSWLVGVFCGCGFAGASGFAEGGELGVEEFCGEGSGEGLDRLALLRGEAG